MRLETIGRNGGNKSMVEIDDYAKEIIPRMLLFNVFVLVHIMLSCYVFNVNFTS